MRYFLTISMICVSGCILACTSSAAQTGTSTPQLQLSIEAPSVIHSGEVAQLTLHVSNVTHEPLTVFSGIPPEEFVVENSDNEEIWSSLATAACPDAADGSPWAMNREDCTVLNGFRVSAGHEWMFGPTEEKVLTGAWDGTTSRTIPVPPGTYSLRGLVELSDGDVAAAPVTITVLP